MEKKKKWTKENMLKNAYAATTLKEKWTKEKHFEACLYIFDVI